MKPEILFRVKRILLFSVIIFVAFLFAANLSYSKLIERVVAIVNDEAILLSEFQKKLKSAKEQEEEPDRYVVIEEMINRILLLEQAKKMRLDRLAASRSGAGDEGLIDEYLQKRIKILIHIPFSEIEAYYAQHKEKYKNRGLFEVKEEIEDILVEQRYKQRLKEHIKMLRQNAYIRIQLDE